LNKTNQGAYEYSVSIPNRIERISFRKPMSWLVKTEASLSVSSINSQILLERLWPKGAQSFF